MEILKPDRTSAFTKLTDSLKTLLFDRNTELNTLLITQDDVETFLQIQQELKNDPGNTKRMRNIRNLFPDIIESYLAKNFKSLASQRAIEYPGSGVTQIDLTKKPLLNYITN